MHHICVIHFCYSMSEKKSREGILSFKNDFDPLCKAENSNHKSEARKEKMVGLETEKNLSYVYIDFLFIYFYFYFYE